MNDGISFAWLLSIDTNIAEWNKFPIMYKWVMNGNAMKCVLFINQLGSNEGLLRLAWLITNTLNKILNVDFIFTNELSDISLKFNFFV